jgi:hypothetical protein
MNRSLRKVIAAVSLLTVLGTVTAPASAQTPEVKEKPRMYT